jgi:hypothetical protein
MRDLVTLLIIVAIGLRLRPEIRVPGLADDAAIRADLRRRDWEAVR